MDYSSTLPTRVYSSLSSADAIVVVVVISIGIKPILKLKGPLAPFNEELTFNFRGPLNLYNIAVYQPGSSGATWTQTSSWAAGQAPNNLVFMNNMGGGASGEWSSAFLHVLWCLWRLLGAVR